MKCKNFILGALAALSIFVFFPTCEIGLGESVDTEPPTGSISSPGANAVIRDAFALQGEWHDEAGIKQVAVELKYNSEGNNKGKKYSYDATINKDNTWTCKIDPESKTQPLVDGTYLATIIIYDNGGHQTKLERSYIIDNTAPVIVLQRPSSIFSSSASDTDTYGQKFTIQGQAADDNNLNKIEVEIYEKCTETDGEAKLENLLKTVTLKNVPLAINNDVANYVSGDTEKITDYSAIYFAGDAYKDLNDMNASEASKTRYCKIIAYDGAQRYPAKGEEKDDDSTGNKQTNYYLYDDISGSILSTYKVNELYAMFNGTYSSSDSSRSVATTTSSILEQLEDKVQTVAKFNLNPKNNPTFSVSGKDQLTDGWTTNDAYNISSGSQVVVEVSPGLDGISLNKDSLKVYFVEYNATTKKVGSVKFYPVTERQAYGSGYKFITTINSSYLGDDNTSKTKIGSNYIFGVDGWDKSNGDEAEGNTIIASGKGYGFHLASSGVAPTLNPTFEISENGTDWTEVTDSILYLKANTYVKVSGTVSVEEGTPDFSLLFGDTDSGASLTAVENSENKFSFTKTFEPSVFGTKTSQRQITVKAWQDKLTTSKTYTVYYDLEAPTISISEVKPIACKYTGETGTTDGKQYLNGDNVSIKLTISDNDSVYTASDDATDEEKAKNPKIEIEDSTSKIISNTNVTTLINFVWDNIPTTQLADGPITIRVTAYDRAGNKKEITNNDFRVDQDTDKPVILPNSASQLTFTADSEDLPASKNKFASGSQLILKLIDDDGLASITPWLGTNKTNLKEKSPFSLPVSSTSETYTYNLPTDVGFHTLRFKLTDSNGKSTYVPSETGCFFVKITAGAPTIQEVKSVVKDGTGAELDAIYTKGTSGNSERYFENTITFDSEYTQFNIYRTTTNVSSDNYSTVIPLVENITTENENLSKVNGSWVYKDTNLRPSETTTWYYFVAGVDGEDKEYSNKKNVTCRVDKDNPEIVLSSVPGASDTKAESYIFSATAKDVASEGTEKSGIDKIILTISGSKTENGIVVEKSKSIEVSGEGAVTASLSEIVKFHEFNEVFAEEGYKTISLKAVDKSGRETTSYKYKNVEYTESAPLTFLYDTANPKLTISTDLREYMPSDGSYKLSGTVSDSYSIQKLTITEVFGDQQKTKEIISDVGTENVTSSDFADLQLPLDYTEGTELTDGTYTYTITLIDKRGNEDSKTFTSIVDKTAPKVSITTPEADTTYKGENAISGKTFQFEGDLEEDNSLSGVYYAIVANGATAPSVPTADVTTAEAWENKGFKKVTNFGTTNWKTKKNFRVKGSAVDPAYPDSLEEGSNYKIIVYAVDKAGNVGHTKGASKAERSFDVDMVKPTIVLTQFDKASGTISSKFNISKTDDNEGKNGVFTVAGTSSDSLGLSKVEITYKKSGSTTEDTETITATDGALSENKWSKTFKFGTNPTASGIGLDNGTYIFKIKATDLVGKVTELEEKTIIVDTISPVIGEISLDGSTYSDDTASSKWYKSTSIELEAIVTDTGSEVTKVQIANSSSSSQWTTINLEDGSTTKYSGTIKFANQGKNKKYFIKAEDKAGNTCTAKELTLNVDTSAPNLKSLFYKVGDGELKTSGGTAYINGTKDLTVYGLYDDQQSGVDGDTGLEFTIGGKPITPKSLVYSAAEVTKDASEVPTKDWISTAEAENSFKALSEFTDKTTIRTWKAVISLSTTQSGMLSVSGSNGAGDSSSYNIFTVSFDTKKPELDNFSLATSSNANTVYKENNETYWVSTEKYKEENVEKTPTFTFTGIATDNTGVESVILNIGGSLVIEYEKDSEGHDTTTVKSKSITGGTEYDIDRDDDEVTVAQWKFSGKSLTGTDQTTAILKVTDIAGNEEYKAYTIKFDNAAPVGLHAIDTSNKDLYFRMGEQERDDGKPSTGTVWDPVWSDSLDKDVGGKYSTDSYGSAQTIKLRGTFKDKVSTKANATIGVGSGVKMIYYKIYETEPDSDTVENLCKNYSTLADGYFSPITDSDKAKEATRRVFYSDSDTTSAGKLTGRTTNVTLTAPADPINVTKDDGTTEKKYYREIESTFKTTISGFKENAVNYLVLVVVDNVGNAGLESVKVPGYEDPKSNYSINVDTLPPVVPTDLADYNTTKFVNSGDTNSTVTIAGTATDTNGSGINKKKLTVKVNNKEVTLDKNTYGTLTVDQSTGSYSKTNTYWKVVLKNTAFTGITSGHTAVVQIEATDNAGNSQTYNIGSVEVDTTAPVPAFTKPAANATVNKTISINGKITEKNIVKSIKLTASADGKTPIVFDYVKDRTDGKTDSISFDTETKEWKIENINTNTPEWNNTTTAKEWTLTLTATDDAANVAKNVVRKITVDQNSDRPVIKVSQIDKTGTGYVNVKTVFGQIDDDDKTDDKTVNKLWLWSTQLNSNNPPSAAPSLSGSTAGWIEFDGAANSKYKLENNSWQIDSEEDDGETTWFWAVADTNNNVFWTKAEDQLQRPYIIYKGETEKSDNTTGISFEYDTVAPEITKIELMRLATSTYKSDKTTRYAASEIAGYITDYNEGKAEKNKLKWVTEDNYVFGADYALMYMKVSVKEFTGMAAYDSSDATNIIYPLKLEGLTEKAAGNNSKVKIGATSFYETLDSATHVYTYIVGPIDFTDYPMVETSESYPRVNIKLTARDGAGKTSPKEKSIYVDNQASITVTKVVPETTKETSGEFEFRVNLKDRESDIKNIQYYIPLSTENNKTSVSALASNKWNDVTELTLDGCVIEFTDFNSIMGYEIDKTTTQPKVKEGFEEYEIKSGVEGQGIYNVPVWFKVTDEVGNIDYVNQYVIKNDSGAVTETKDIIIKYNPNTDRPKVYINDPAITATPVEKGGKIKISGSAEDNEGIAAVYLQFDMGTGTFADGTETVPTTNIKATKANNTKNWNYTLDVGSIENEKTVRVRAIAVDTDTSSGQLVSAWSDILSIKVNNTVPSFENMYLRQYDGTTVKVEKEYQTGMFVKGSWILEGTVSTVNSDYLQQISIGGKTWTRHETVNEDESKTTSLVSEDPYPGATVSFVQNTSDKTITFAIPVVSGSSSRWNVEIEAYDKANNHNTETPTIYIDENAPKFADYVGEESDEVIKLYQDSYGGSGQELGTSHFLKNSNGSKFTLAGKVKEPDGESGFEKAVFYFERFTGSGNSKSNPRVYNVMESRGSDNAANKTLVAADKAGVDPTHPIYINTDKLPVRAITVTRPSTGELSAEEIKTNLNIRNGGLVLVGGLYRTITSVDRTNGLVTISPADETNATKAEFVYGMVVDHNGEGENSDGTLRMDDGDGMLESYSGSQTAGYRWEATFNSANIPDGPIEIHVVVFDQAGNIGHGYMTTRASNNAPRITKVMLGTDLNGNGVFDYGSGEFNTFYAQRDDNQNPITKTGLENWNLKTKEHLGNNKSWKVKNGIAVIPEFVGGAPDFYFQFSKGAASLDTPKTIASDDLNSRKLLGSGDNPKIKLSGTNDNATWSYSTNKVDDVDVTNYGGSLTMTTAEINDASGTATEDAEVYYRFTFWDSTEESTPGTDTGSTILNIQLIQDLEDNVDPTAEIEPFVWNGTGYTKQVSTSVNGGTATTTADVIDTLEKGNNQYYVLGTETVTTSTTDESGKVTTTVTKTTVTPKNSLYGASKANGHIELQEHIKGISAITSALGSDDPKVSGKITFHGTAFDETRLSSIWFKFDDFTPANTLSGGDSSKTPADGYSQAAYYNKTSATWTLASATIADGWEISVTDKEFSQDGHTVDWYLSIDTAKISDVAGKDKAFTIVALDASGGKSTIYDSGKEDQTKVGDDEKKTPHKTPYYKVDVVPYITEIKTSLDDAYLSDPSAYNRSALGYYPVLRGETGIVIKGFNFDISATVSKGNKTTADSGSVTISIPDDATTGELAVTVNSVTSLNNLNNETLEYNQEPNSSNNKILTNRRRFYVWGNENRVADSSIRYPTFRVGSKGEEVFSYDQGGTGTYLYKDGTSYSVGDSYTQWYDTAVSVDNNGNLYGLALNGDCASPGSKDYEQCASFYLYPLVSQDIEVWAYTNGDDGRVEFANPGAFAWENTSNGTRYNPNRIQNPKLVTIMAEDGTSYIYSTYYDATEKLVKFRAGKTTTKAYNKGTTNVSFTYNSRNKTFTGRSNDDSNKFVLINGNYYKLTSKGRNNSYPWNYYYTIDGYTGTNNFSSYIYTINSSVAVEDSIGNYSNGSGGSATGYQTIASGSEASEYSALAVYNGTAIVCWYDSAAKSLKLKYNTTPNSETAWSGAITIDSGLAGWYPDMVVDGEGGIHIAYYGASTGDLKYAYLTSYTDQVADVCTVDGYLSVGTRASISVSTSKKSFTVGQTTVQKYVPFISYYMGAFVSTPASVRTAWPVALGTNKSASNTYVNGAVNDQYTGNWEVQTLPLDSFPTDYTIGIGVKNTSTTEDAAAEAEGNIILGYGTLAGLETARLY